MAPKKSTKKTVAFEDAAPEQAPEAAQQPPLEPVVEEIEEVVAESAAPAEHVTFVVAGGPGEDDEDDLDEDDLHDDDELAATVGQLGQLLMTDEGEAITDVLAGIRDALDKQNKILYRGLQLLESRR